LIAFGYDQIKSSKPSLIKVSQKTKDASTEWELLPQVTFTELDGKTFTFEDLKGEVVLLNFWVIWCPSCATKFPAMLQLVEEYKGKIILVALSNDETKEDIDRFLVYFEKEFKRKLDSPIFI